MATTSYPIIRRYWAYAETGVRAMGDFADEYRIAQSIQPTTTLIIDSVGIEIKKVNSPTDNVVIVWRDDNGNEPSATAKATSSSITGSALTTTTDPNRFTFTPKLVLYAGTRYWFSVERTGPEDNTNVYHVSNDNGNPNPNGRLLRRSQTGAWNEPAAGEEITMDFGHMATSGLIYLASGFTSSTSARVVGTAQATTTAMNEGTVLLSGNMKCVFCTAPNSYFLGSYPGAIQSVSGALYKYLGYSLTDGKIFWSVNNP